MTRTILILTMLLPAAASADDGSASRPAGTAAAAVAAEQAASQQTQARPESRTRRPSMVGYIDDGLVHSQVRIRFDAGYNDQFPDRAEFFYAKCGCYMGLATAIPEAFDPNAPGPGLGVPNNVNFQQLYIDAEYAPVARFSVFAELPVRWLQPQGFQAIPPFPPFSNQSGLGDIRAGVKVAIVSLPRSTLTAQLRTYMPSGDAAQGLGTNHWSIEPALLYYQQVTDRFVIESQVGDWHPTGGSAGVPTASADKFSGDVIFYGIGPSYEVYRSDQVRFAPVVELVGWSVRGGFQTEPGGPLAGAAAAASGTNIVNLKIRARAVVREQNSFYVGYGHALTNADWYDNILRIEYRYSF